ncbi:MAG TPA: YlxR family protein [Microlunatus sp.]
MGPVRTCVGCRERADKADLLRLVWRGTLVADDRQIEPGRGAYLHRRAECLQAAVRRRAIGRALRIGSDDLREIDYAALAGSLA